MGPTGWQGARSGSAGASRKSGAQRAAERSERPPAAGGFGAVARAVVISAHRFVRRAPARWPEGRVVDERPRARRGPGGTLGPGPLPRLQQGTASSVPKIERTSAGARAARPHPGVTAA
ncbi:hypothetical protein GCM10010495_76040 [Kitasatospora herbaricolor]|nr:hypothetical protein GCM10010495_76040 [Kitasatospora herbaricolor]